MDISRNKKASKNPPNTKPIGKYFILFLDKLFNLDSNIMIENKNKIAMAPTYINIKSSPKNSHSNRNNKNAENKKLVTKKSNEKTGCCDKTTMDELKTKNIENT